MKRIKVGLVISPQMIDSLAATFNILQGVGEVLFLAPDDRRPVVDIVVLPNVGITPNLACFIHNGYSGIPISPMCPFLERFRLNLDYYIENEIHVIGLGESAAILWDLLSQKCAVTTLGTQLICPDDLPAHIQVVGKRDYFIDGFTSNLLHGFKYTSAAFSSHITNLKQNMLLDLTSQLESSKNNNDPHAEVCM